MPEIIEKSVGTKQANIVLNAIGDQAKPTHKIDLMVRIAVVEVLPQYLNEYLAFAHDIAKK